MPRIDAGCLDEATVVEFVDATLASPQRAAVEAHLTGCAACADLVTWAAADLRAGTRPLSGAPLPRGGRLNPGTRVERYQILERVGRGGMGEVYAAYHPDLDRKIALKVVDESGPATAERQGRLLREAKAIARLSHPNVVTVYDAGTVADRVYVAMEFVDGLTIDRWLDAAPRSWRQILDVFIAAGRGLAAAHAAGLVHRDFKPQNVMIGRDGSVRVMDFGLARSTGAPEDAAPPAADLPHEAAPAPPMVTRAGTIVGTPAYMAPEQFRGERADARSDQFSFCVALYEALHGERPFGGESVLSLRFNVTEGELRPAISPKAQDVPLWIRRPLLRGLRVQPDRRFPTMTALIDALAADPAVRRRRFLGAGAITAVVAASLLVAWQTTARRRAAADREISQQVEEATRAIADARSKAAEATTLRTRTFAAFDRADRRSGEQLWRGTRALLPIIDADYDRAGRSLEAAVTLDQNSAQRRARLADLRYEHLLFAEDFRLGNKAELLAERLAAVDTDGSRRNALAAPGTLALRTTPTAARVLLERYDRDPVTGRRRAVTVGPLPVAPSVTELRPGSYRAVIDGDGFAQVIYPFEIRRAERTSVELSLPAASAVPQGFVYIAPGSFWFGDTDEALRTQFLDTAPIHRRTTGAYLVARHETTYRDWIAFLDALPAAERARYAPSVSGTMRGALLLRAGPDGWHLSTQPGSRRYQAGMHEPIIYEGRNRRARQDWLQFPIGGISPDDVARYLTWLRSSGRVAGARLCTETEWERVARGADDRLFPHGDELAGDDANFDLTYDRVDDAYGPDEVGAHRESRSPFDVDDLAGNVMEIVSSSEVPGGFIVRGGAYYISAASARSNNRTVIPRSFRDVTGGLRVCADAR